MLRYSNKLSRFAALGALLMLSACIKNDVPYPVVKARFIAFEVYDQKEAAIIDETLREVRVTLNETADPYNVEIKDVRITAGATCSPELGATLDLSSPLEYTLSTYQSYVWTVKATQDISREFKFAGQSGTTSFDTDNRIVVAYAPYSKALDDIAIDALKLGPLNCVMTPDPATVTDFTEPQTFKVVSHGREEYWQVYILHTEVVVETNTPAAADIWATRATLSGSFQSDSPEEHGFEYRKQNVAAWTKVPQANIVTDGSQMSALIATDAGTAYACRAYLGGEHGDEVFFQTEEAMQVPNMSFDNWIKDGKSWYPNTDLTDANYWWDSGNRGANTLAEKNPTEPEESVVIKGKAARLGSTKVLSVFAAGSIYTGYFLERVGFGAKLSFGRPYTSRPLRMKGYYNYTPGIIDYAKAPHTSLMGKRDSCNIYCLLTDWAEPFIINTNTENFIDFENDRNIIAYGGLKTDRNTNGYEAFDIELVYRSLTRKPKYIVIVAAASKYGDYFTGSTSSTLYVDEFSLEF